MDTEVDLTTVDRAVLIAIIAQLQATVLERQRVIERLERRIAELEGQAKSGGPPRMPGLKAKPGRQPPVKQQPRKQRRHGFARRRMTPTQRVEHVRVEHVMENGPDCGTHLTGGWTQRTREVIELPVAPVRVTEHVYIARTCPTRTCPARLHAPGGTGRCGFGTAAPRRQPAQPGRHATEEARMPFRTIQRYLDTVQQRRVSAGAIVGANGYVWTFSTPTERYFLRRGRGKTVVDEALNDAFSGVLVSDCYAVYHHYDGPKQRCWAHLLRDIIAIAICAVICGADSWVYIELFGKSKEEWFQTFLELPHGIPSHDTFGDVFSRLDPEQFQQCFMAWTQAVSDLIPGEVVASDGKTVRRSHDRNAGQRAIHLVSAWASANTLTLGQVKTTEKSTEKSNEITAIPQLLPMLELRGCIVTIDAMGCQQEIAQGILDRGANYVLALKENQEGEPGSTV